MTVIYSVLNNLIARHGGKIESWLREHSKHTEDFFYHSVDIRHAGWKLAPVDTNLFPAGFNNLSEASIERAIKEVRTFFSSYYPNAMRVLLIPEYHTKNERYHENVLVLRRILVESGLKVQLGGVLNDPLIISDQLVIEPLERNHDKIQTRSGFTPDIILLNNDLTSGMPEILKNIDQPVIPPPIMGWHRRKKSIHFSYYQKLAESFGKEFGIDPWLISTVTEYCGKVNFKEREGLECVALGVEKTLHAIREHYARHGIKETPYVFIKADRGTYGIGIMTARSGEEVYDMNKQLRHQMNVIREGLLNTEVLIQEGVPTIDSLNGMTAEPMAYLINHTPIAIIYRMHAAKDAYGNLNRTGAEFLDYCDESDARHCHFNALGLIGRLAAIASQQEKECYRESEALPVTAVL